ncbi:MBL fold metallo-hydrolase [Thiospirochaeta perfilievii]|uniref:MBL fold metallo-hydrolase n=1 Tax=Thiospirochaeta perfilievii TaxID=252967 RepID=A0A5C1QGP9_9SPIO|nr:MBL fold metallo-hydrolase [Thiospirochaeta perfilievii]QEN05746.1 MBL fold metallo-hydrolase [Thiospirochaeta perfilievii]
MKKTVITKGITYLEVPEENIRILCGCPENSIKFIMQIGLTQPVDINGFKLVSGPNAILLNDYSILNSHFLNFAEFPLLHHQYFQGASFNGTNEKFILIGNKNRVDDQYEYIRRGLHGLTSLEEILEAGVDVITAERILAIGDYHRGKNKEFNIINKVYLDKKTNIKGDLFVQRLAINKFKFTYNNEEEIIDINLNEFSKGVGLPYKIRNRHIKFDEFSVTTVGDGNGWNSDVPCMGAVINSKGKRFLVDSGPGSLDLIRHLGIMPSEVEGVFVTHSHDDHFAGLLSLLNSENKIKFFSTPLIISSVQKKFQALLNISRNELKRLIDFIELKENMWTNIGEMEVKPNYSFHTIETNIFYFRVKNSDGDWKSYGHITDIISRKDLDYMLEHDQSQKITKDWANLWFNHYLEECDLKRVDAGEVLYMETPTIFLETTQKK